MPRTKPSDTTAESQALQNFNDHFDQATERTAASMGRPLGAKDVGDAEKVRLWGASDPKVDPAQIVAQLLTTGVDPSLLDPNNLQALAVAKAAPDLAPLYGQPTEDDELAQILAAFAAHPFRHALLAGLIDPEDRVKESDRLQRAWEKQHGGQEDSPVSSTVAPAGAMPPLPPDPTAMVGG